ncbi:MAG: hypothetical protein ABI222_01660, partial [Opitutaceae bacterium]
MMINLLLAVGSAWLAMALWPSIGLLRGLSVGFACLGLWQLYCAIRTPRHALSPVVLQLGGFTWRLEDFCRGWLITGQIGTGKT